MPYKTALPSTKRPSPRFSPLALLVGASIALSGCVSSSGKDGVAELLTPDQASVDAAADGGKDGTLAHAASPSPEYQVASNGDSIPAPSAPGEAPPGGDPAAKADMAGAVMQATGINANRASIFSSGMPQAAAQPGMEGSPAAQPAAPAGGFNAVNASFFSSSGKNPLLSAPSADSKGGNDETAEMEEDDVPLILRGKLYSSNDLGPDPNDTATDMVTLASLPSMTRQSLTGLLVQSPRVNTSCFKPKLLALLHGAEQHFGKRLVVTSGFRDPEHNLRVGGAKHSMHLSCDAADIQMVGVSKWDLARYFRQRADIGGVGTYCTTNSIHVDIGRRRDWNWKCRTDTEL